MLRFMRENTGSWIIKIILGLIVVVFVFLGMGSFGADKRNQVALVNDMPITMDEYRRSYQNTIEQMRQRFGNNLNDEMLQMLQVKKQAMDRLIEERLIDAEAHRLDIQVSDREIQVALAEIPAFQKNGVFDLATYRMVLSRNRLTPENFEAMQRENMRRSKVIGLIMKSVKVSDMEASEWYRQNNSEVAVRYVKFDPATFTVTTDDAGISDYYEKNKENYKSEATRTVQYLKYAFDNYKDQVEITADNIALYYDENPDQFTTPEQAEASHILIKVAQNADDAAVEAARQEAEAVYKKAIDGADFAELAKEFSQGPTKDRGGYLGKFGRKSMVKPFADKVFSMQADEISEPVRTRFGWHVIKVQARIDESKKTLEAATDEIKETLLNDEIKNMAYNVASSAFDAIIDGDTLEQAGRITTQEVQTVGPFTMKGPDEGFENGFMFARTAFEVPMNEISDIKEIGKAYYIIKPVEKSDPAVLPLVDVKDQVTADYKASLQDAAAKQSATDFLAAVPDGAKIVDIAKEKGLELKETPFFKKDGNIEGLGRESELAAAAFKLSETNNVASEVVKGNGGYYVVSLKERKVPTDDVITENMASVKETLSRTKQSEFYTAWVEKLKSDSTIEIQPGLLEG